MQISEINDVVGMEGQRSRDCGVTESGSTEDQNRVRKVNSCRPREKLLKLGEDEMNEAEDEDGVYLMFQICQIFPRL